MTKKYVSIDFEYNSTAEEKLNLVCCSMSYSITEHSEEHWLYKDDNSKKILKRTLLKLNDLGFVFIAFNVVAEAQSFIALGLDPTDFNWIDVQLEWKMLINHNHKYQYGKQMIDGKKKVTSPPMNKWKMTEEDKKLSDNSKPGKSLVSCL